MIVNTILRLRTTWFACTLFAVAVLLSGCTTAREKPVVVRVMTYNVHHGVGTDQKLDLQRIADVIKHERADIIGLQEIDRGVERSERRDLIEELSQLTGMHYYFDRNITYQGGDYGNAILTRFPIVQKTNTHFKMIRKGEQRGVQETVVRVGHRDLVFMNTHIDYRDDDKERQLNVRELAALVAKHKGTPLVLCGDFNDVPDSRIYNAVQEFVTDGWLIKGKGPGLTLYSDVPEKRIDYIFVSKEGIEVLDTWVPQTQASDHLPVVADLLIK